jgi:hypothetical protein
MLHVIAPPMEGAALGDKRADAVARSRRSALGSHHFFCRELFETHLLNTHTIYV